MINLEQAKAELDNKDFEIFEELFYIQLAEEHLSPQWYTTREMMQQILRKYDLDDGDPFDLGM